MQAVFGTKAQEPCLATEKHHRELCLIILDREINVPGSSRPQIADFAFEPKIGESALDFRAKLRCEFAYSPDAALGLCFFESEAELAGRVEEVPHDSSVYMRSAAKSGQQ